MKRICIVTGTRAEYGLLRPLLKRIKNTEGLMLQLVVTGSHLSPEFGLTYEEILADGFTIDEKVEILLSSDSQIGITKAMGLAMISFSEIFERLNPDLLVLLGDRYEIFAVASAATIARIPIAHLHGGETTSGAYDEAFRHSITKMSYLHFTSTERYRNRVIQLGEAPDRVFNVGAIGLESILTRNLMSKKDLEKSLNFDFKKHTALVTYHPVTLENDSSEYQFQALLDAVEQFHGLRLIFTKANADSNGRIINHMIDTYVTLHPEKSIAFSSMGQLRYLSAMQYADVVIGNSSSGIIEAPSFHIPTINIGNRQLGRIQAASTINCEADTFNISNAIQKSLSDEFKSTLDKVCNPYQYGDRNVSEHILRILQSYLATPIDLKKNFYDLAQ